MNHPSPRIFVSATTADLGTCRLSVRNALLTIGCTPEEQTTFPPDWRDIREMLRVKIAACDAVVHVAGLVYGSEPQTRPEGEPRRSYTQLEYEIARELKKPVYSFVCGEEFPYDPHEPEDDERRRLQQEHRERILGGDTKYEPVGTDSELREKVLTLQTKVEELVIRLERERAWRRRGVVAGLALAVVLGGGLLWVNQRTSQTSQRVAQLETELDRQRRYINSVANAFGEQQRQLVGLKLTDEQIFERAVASVAEREGMDAGDLRASINLFVAAVRADPAADFFDLALADFAQQNFASASANAGKAADEARTRRLAAEALAERATAEAKAARNSERDALTLGGRSLAADRRFGEAIAVFEQALALTPRESLAADWAVLQVEIGNSASEWASAKEGSAIAECRARGISAYRAALEVYTRAALPQGWAMTQNNLANALSDQASASEGEERARLLGEAVTAYRAALEVCTRAAVPQDWATTQNNLANALSDQASASEAAERARLLGEAVTAYRASLEVRTRAALPHGWATTQNNLAVALQNQASASEGAERARLLGEAVTAYRAALEVYTRAALPQDWAMTQNNLANALSDQASATEGADRARLLGEAVTAYRAALEVRTRAALPQEWAATQNNLANALSDQASASEGAERARLLGEAVTASRAALAVYTRAALPQDWARTQSNLALALRDRAMQFEGEDRIRLLDEAASAMRACGEVYTEVVNPAGFAARKQWIAAVEAEVERLRGE
jgi:tetratricopeptide (TPR) repeat protein